LFGLIFKRAYPVDSPALTVCLGWSALYAYGYLRQLFFRTNFKKLWAGGKAWF